mgnify:CR=1 FL=1
MSATDIKIWAPKEIVVTTINGDNVSVPAISLGKELKILRIIGDAWKSSGISEIDDLKSGNVPVMKIVEWVTTNIPDYLLSVVSIILDRETQWIEDHLDLETTLALVVPFLLDRMKKIQAQIVVQ